MSKFMVFAMLVGTLSCSEGGASSGTAGSGGSGGSGGGVSEWKQGDCAALGADTMPSGSCYLGCSTGSDCPSGATCVNQQYQPYCRVNPCNSALDCGPQGWACQGNHLCYITCTQVTSGASDECPPGYQCHQGLSTEIPTCSKVPGSSCGEPCPAGCCSPSGNICCQPPFCTGDCLGSPCCN